MLYEFQNDFMRNIKDSLFQLRHEIYFKLFLFYVVADLLQIIHLCHVSGNIQFCSFAQLCPTLYNHMDCGMPGFPVHHQLLELAQTHVH